MKRLRERRLDEATGEELYNKLKKQYPGSPDLTPKAVNALALLDPETLERDGFISRCGPNTVVLLQWLAGKPSEWKTYLQAVIKSAKERERLGKTLADFKRYQVQIKAMGLPTALQDVRDPLKLEALTKLLRLTSVRPELPKISAPKRAADKGVGDRRKWGYEWANNGTWALYSPFTFGGSQMLAKPASWCTGRTQAQYSSYKTRGGLFILQNLADPQWKFQLSNVDNDEQEDGRVHFNDVSNSSVVSMRGDLKQYCDNTLKDPEIFPWLENCFTGGGWYNRLMTDQAGLEAEQEEKLAAEKAAQPKSAKPQVSQEVKNFRDFVATVASTDANLLIARLKAEPALIEWATTTRNWGMDSALPLWRSFILNPEFRSLKEFDIPLEALKTPAVMLKNNKWILAVLGEFPEYWKKTATVLGEGGIVQTRVPLVTDAFLKAIQKLQKNDPTREPYYAMISGNLRTAGPDFEDVRASGEGRAEVNLTPQGSNVMGSKPSPIQFFAMRGDINVALPQKAFETPEVIVEAGRWVAEWKRQYYSTTPLVVRATPDSLTLSIQKFLAPMDLFVRCLYYLWFVAGLGELIARILGLRKRIATMPAEAPREEADAIDGNIRNLENQTYSLDNLWTAVSSCFHLSETEVVREEKKAEFTTAQLAAMQFAVYSSSVVEKHLKDVLRDSNARYALQRFATVATTRNLRSSTTFAQVTVNTSRDEAAAAQVNQLAAMVIEANFDDIIATIKQTIEACFPEGARGAAGAD